MPGTTLILGGTSAVAMAYARLTVKSGDKIVLVGRNNEKLERNLADIKSRGADSSIAINVDLADTDQLQNNWNIIFERVGEIDKVLIAYGVLGDQVESQNNSDALADTLKTNFISAAMWAEIAFEHFRQNGAGQLTVIGSVAGDRGRQSNYHYGSAKGGLELFMQGMQHRAAKLREAKVRVLLVKPGFIDTPMTDHIDKGGPLWATPEKIAQITLHAEKRGRRVVYAPWFWRIILLIIKSIPFFVFKRTSL